MTSDLEEIARRVEAATGPDRALDALIDRLLNDRPKNGDYDESEGAFWRVSEPWCGLLERPNGFARGSFCAARYTASLDAAMTLVPNVTTWGVGAGTLGQYARIVLDEPEAAVWSRDAATPALALAAAALRARAHLGGNDAR